MRENNFRTRIATGSFTLPVAVLVAAAVLCTAAPTGDELWKILAVVAVTTYALIELSNRNALLRVRSRMVSSTYLVILAACPFMAVWSTDLLPAVALVLTYFALFAAYQQPHPAGYAFHAGLFVGIGSLFYPPMILLEVVVVHCLLVQLRALNWRSLLAVVFGAVLPYWFLAGWGIWENRIDTIFVPYLEAFNFGAPDYAALTLPQMLVAGYVVVLSLCAAVHFTRTAYNDKIRTRMYFYVFLVLEVVLVAALAFQPQCANVLMHMLIVNSAPIIAHHFTLGRGRALNVWFIICLVLLAGIIGTNYYLILYAGSH